MNAVSRAILGAATAAACVLVFASWRFFRSRSRRTKKVAIMSAIGLAAIIVAYAAVRQHLSKRIRPGEDPQLQNVAHFVQSNRGRITSWDKRLAAIRAMVVQDDWLPQTEQTHKGDGAPALVFWVHELTREEPEGAGPASRELKTLEQMVRWAQDPGTMAGTYNGQSPKDLANLLDQADAPYVIIAKMLDVTQPKVRNVSFAKGGGVSGEFVAGRVAFRIGVVARETGAVVATGKGTATNSSTVRITASPDVLASDLWWRANVAALALGRRLLDAER